MVMGRRPGVRTASPAVAAIDTAGLIGTFAAALARIPLRAPWRGPRNVVRNVAVSSTREFVRSLIGYMTSLPIDEFRALEIMLDDISGAVLPAFVAVRGATMDRDTVGGVPGIWVRVRGHDPVGTIVYLHGGGYIGTSPTMYVVFMAHLAQVTKCDVFVADYRLAPEFPYPAATEDVVAVIRALQRMGVPANRMFLAGDSGGGGLVGSVMYACACAGDPLPAGVVLFSPEVSLVLSEPSVVENAENDILPWNVPTNSYLHGVDPDDQSVAVLKQDLSSWPPTFVAYGDQEIFRDAIRQFVERLQDSGVSCDAHEAADMFHVFPFLLPWARESRRVYDQVGEFVANIVLSDATISSPADSGQESGAESA